MFYSDTLLSKTGPLARVWLSANVERKLTKSHILDSNIESSAEAIADQGQAPLALRLSGQLLFGLVRIYSRKARYLHDDCSETIVKIKMAFKPGNVDLPAEAKRGNAADLILPDLITDLDLLAPMPPPDLLLDDFQDYANGEDPSLLDSSQAGLGSFDRARRRGTSEPALDDVDLGIDMEGILGQSTVREQSVELGRDQRSDLLDDQASHIDEIDEDLIGPLDGNESVVRQPRESSVAPGMMEDDDAQMGGVNDDQRRDDDNEATPTGRPAQSREVDSPLMPPRDSRERDMSSFDQEVDDTTVVQPQRAKRRKLLQADSETEMRSAEIRALQNDRSKILKPAQFLPKDPLLLALMQMQREGNFASSILGDGFQRGLAPELRGVLSLEVVRKSAERKRKRAEGLPSPSVERDESLHLQLPADEEELHQPGGALDLIGGDTTLNGDGGLNDEENILPGQQSRSGTQDPDFPHDEDEGMAPQNDLDEPNMNFDETTAPLLHPSEQGAVSLGTKHAVHVLRERFGPDASSTSTPSKRTKANVLFQDMMPEASTTRAEATKMFFEVLVLATKDAVKVEQEGEELGGPLRVRGKRGLWGDWAGEGLTEGGTQEVVA